jgi:hypothetical protein
MDKLTNTSQAKRSGILNRALECKGGVEWVVMDTGEGRGWEIV